MTTYSISSTAGGFSVVATRETLSWKRDRSACYSQRVVAGPFAHKGMALAEANLLASQKPGNRVES